MSLDLSFSKRDALLAGVIKYTEERQTKLGTGEPYGTPTEYEIARFVSYEVQGLTIYQGTHGVDDQIIIQYLRGGGKGKALQEQLTNAGVPSEVW